MKVFKFGGASIKDAAAIKNMAGIISRYQQEQLIVVVSAMGKSTNALENLLIAARKGQQPDTDSFFSYHSQIVSDLQVDTTELKQKLSVLKNSLIQSLTLELPYDQHYDQVISHGELFSSSVIDAYLNQLGVNCHWLDARNYIITTDDYRHGIIEWNETEDRIKNLDQNTNKGIILTQGFIGRSLSGETSTLGREGSDFSAAIFASCLNAESVTVWKDVPGILNADPKIIEDAQLFNQIHYKEAAEMTYYGASVIHPKTIKPLAVKNIPLFVKSFDNPENPGTIIFNHDNTKPLPTIIIKNDQCLITFKVLDYTFINEENLSLIFKEFAQLDVKINIMQNSAISFSAVINYDEEVILKIIEVLKSHFDIRYNTGLTLITIKNYDQDTLAEYRKGKNILLEQMSRNNYRALYLS